MHAGAVEGQSAFAAEGVVDGPEEGGPRSEKGEDQLGQAHGERIEVPSGMAEEAMKPAPVSVTDIASREDDLGDIAVTMGEDPARDDEREGLEGRGREDRGEILKQGGEGRGKFHGSASLYGWLVAMPEPMTSCQNIARKPT